PFDHARRAGARDPVLVPAWNDRFPAVPRLAAAGGVHLLGDRAGLCDCPAVRGCAAPAGAGPAATVSPARRSGARAARVRRRQRGTAVLRLGGGVEADRGDPARGRSAGNLGRDLAAGAAPVARLAQWRMAGALPLGDGGDLLPQLV